ncbi:hypothetical protein RYX36_006566 [Vicia faba]
MGHTFNDLIPTEGSKFDGMTDKLFMDGANYVGGEKLKNLHKLLNVFDIGVRNSSEVEGVLNDDIGVDHVQKEKVASRGFVSKGVGIRLVCSSSDAKNGYLHPKNCPLR